MSNKIKVDFDFYKNVIDKLNEFGEDGICKNYIMGETEKCKECPFQKIDVCDNIKYELEKFKHINDGHHNLKLEYVKLQTSILTIIANSFLKHIETDKD